MIHLDLTDAQAESLRDLLRKRETANAWDDRKRGDSDDDVNLRHILNDLGIQLLHKRW